MAFSEVADSWARAQLVAAKKPFTAIRNVSFGIMHTGGCYGHTEDEYCYCETSSYVEITIFYFNGAKNLPCHHHSIERDNYQFADLLKELVEWPH